MLPKKHRLPFPTRFTKQSVYHTPLFTLTYGRNTENLPRVGIIVNKRVAPHAVDRNSLKRQFREHLYPLLSQMGSYDLLFVLRKASKEKNALEIHSAIMATLEKVNIL